MDDVDRRLDQLERSTTRVEHTLFGNGDVGMDERLRHVEETQERHETARRADRQATEQSIRTIDSRLDRIEIKFNESVGAWKVAKWAAGLGLPLVVSLLVYIVRQVS